MLVQMEIGQQFLMLQIDKKITSDDLSILIFQDRIAFCTLEQTLYFNLEKKILILTVLVLGLSTIILKKIILSVFHLKAMELLFRKNFMMKQTRIYIYL